MRFGIALGFAFALSACAGDRVFPSYDVNALFSGRMTLTGQYRYIDGDVFIYECGGSVCADTLIRDAYLQAHVNELEGRMITIVVERIAACDAHKASQVACIGSVNPSALRIAKWIRPSPGQ